MAEGTGGPSGISPVIGVPRMEKYSWLSSPEPLSLVTRVTTVFPTVLSRVGVWDSRRSPDTICVRARTGLQPSLYPAANPPTPPPVPQLPTRLPLQYRVAVRICRQCQASTAPPVPRYYDRQRHAAQINKKTLLKILPPKPFKPGRNVILVVVF